MITLEQAKNKFNEIIASSGEDVEIVNVWELQFDDPVYVVMCVDANGKKIYPGEKFPSIRKADGKLVDWTEPCPS